MTTHALHRPRLLSMLVLAGLGLASMSAHADDDRFSGGWHSALTIYGWLPGVSADLRFEVPGSGNVTTKSDNNIFDKLEGAFMIQGEVRNGEWGFFGDADWVKFGDQKGRESLLARSHEDEAGAVEQVVLARLREGRCHAHALSDELRTRRIRHNIQPPSSRRELDDRIEARQCVRKERRLGIGGNSILDSWRRRAN